MLSGIPSLSRNLWIAAYCLAIWALTHSITVAVDGFDDHKWIDVAIGVYWALFALFVMVARYPNGLRKFPIVEPQRPAPRPSRR